MTDKENLKELFYNPKSGLVNLEKLKQKAKEAGIKLSSQEIEKFYKSQQITNLLKPVRKPKYFNSIVANYPTHIYQMDIINYQRYKIHSYQYILVVIDIYSRYIQIKAMTNRRLPTIIKAFEEIINKMGAPFKLQCDNEFNKKEFINVLEKYDIKPSFSEPYEINKNAIVERVNATILLLLQKIRLLKKPLWYKYIDDITTNYNNSIHSTTTKKPEDIFLGKEPNEQTITNVEYKLKAGDKVRKVFKKKSFDKIDTLRLSKNIYTIESIKKNKIKLFDDDKLYKPYELKITYTQED